MKCEPSPVKRKRDVLLLIKKLTLDDSEHHSDYGRRYSRVAT